MAINYSELAIFVTSCAGAIAGLVIATQKSRCSHIKCCYGLIGCDRQIPSVLECNDLESQLSNITDIPNIPNIPNNDTTATAPTPCRTYREDIPNGHNLS